jgi:hypothetical protein
VGLTSRHDDTEITRFINEAIQTFRENVSAIGIAHYLTSATGTLSAGVTSGYPFQLLSLSALSPNVVRVYGFDVQLTDRRWVSLRSEDFSQRCSYQWNDDSGGRVPEAFSNVTTYQLAILPAPGYSMSYRVWYLPVLTDLSAGGDTFDGVTGWEDFVVYEACCRALLRDRRTEAYSVLASERERAWAQVAKGAARVNAAGGTLRRQDTMGRGLAARARNMVRG